MQHRKDPTWDFFRNIPLPLFAYLIFKFMTIFLSSWDKSVIQVPSEIICVSKMALTKILLWSEECQTLFKIPQVVFHGPVNGMLISGMN
jgi:hypothetical protein